MRIISKFRDFYDGVQGTFQDTDMKWLRTSPFAKDKAPEEPVFGMDNQPCKLMGDVTESERLDNMPPWSGARWFVLGFCGKVYFIMEHPDEKDPWIGNSDPKPKNLIWTVEDWQRRRAKEYKRYAKDYRKKAIKQDLKRATEFFHQKPLPEVENIFTEYHTPLFFIRRVRYSYDNPQHRTALFVNTVSLKGLGWQKRMDAFTTYQEIMMFLGSMAHPEPHMTQIADKDQIVKKGFDLRTSFRHPTK